MGGGGVTFVTLWKNKASGLFDTLYQISYDHYLDELTIYSRAKRSARSYKR